MLEEPNVIDIISTTPDGKVLLVITDAGLTADQGQRAAMYAEKLRAYVAYASGEELGRAHPGKTLADVRIRIMSPTPPPGGLDGLSSVSPAGDPTRAIPVEYVQFP
jgi:hypothetical protein